MLDMIGRCHAVWWVSTGPLLCSCPPSSSCFLPLSLENHLPVRDVGIKAVNLHHGEARATVIEGRPPPTVGSTKCPQTGDRPEGQLLYM